MFNEILERYLIELREKLIAKYDEFGLRASGSYENELEYEIEGSRMTMYGAPHSEFMDKGRGTGPEDYRKIAPFIQQWIETKDGLPQEFYERKNSISFAIAHKIANEGIKVPNQFNKGDVVTSVVNDFLANDLQAMINEMGEHTLGIITEGIKQVFKEVAL